MQTCNVKQILDFTFLREILFGSTNAEISVVFAKREKPDSKSILHATFRRTKLSKEKIYLELDHYDLHAVAYEDALNNPLIWKSNLLGGGRLYHLISRFSGLSKFGDYAEEKKVKDMENIPFPENINELELSEVEKILVDDVLDYMPDFRNNGENSELMQPVNPNQLSMFGKTYCKVLNTVYEKFKPFEPIVTDNFVCYPIYYGDESQLETGDFDQFENYLNRLANKKSNKHIRITRVIRIYDRNVIYLVKPKPLRYWMRSVAVRDADETFEDLVKQGY